MLGPKRTPAHPAAGGVAIATTTLAVNGNRTSVVLRCPGKLTCTGFVSLGEQKSAGTVILGGQNFSIRPGALAEVKITLTTVGMKALRSASTHSPVQVKIVASTASATASRSARVV